MWRILFLLLPFISCAQTSFVAPISANQYLLGNISYNVEELYGGKFYEYTLSLHSTDPFLLKGTLRFCYKGVEPFLYPTRIQSDVSNNCVLTFRFIADQEVDSLFLEVKPYKIPLNIK